MSLAIAKLETVCRVRASSMTPEARALAAAVDRIGREALPGEIAAALGPSLDRQAPVIRIRRLPVELHVSATQFDAASIAREWARAFARALFQALAYPDGHAAVPVRRFPSRAAYMAAFLDESLRGSPGSRWEFQELDGGGHADPRTVMLNAVQEDPDLLGPLLRSLDERGSLAVILSAFDELTLERLVRLVSERVGSPPGRIEPELLARVAFSLGRHHVERRWSLVSHRQALRLWALLPGDSPPTSPRQVLWALETLRWLLEYGWAGAEASPVAFARLPEPAREWLSQFGEHDGTRDEALRLSAGLAPAVEQVRTRLPDLVSAAPSPAARSIRSDWMGVMLLSGTVLRLDWWHSLVVSRALAAVGGVRAFRYLLCGVAAACRGRHIDSEFSPDPADALFAGIVEDTDRAGLIEFFQTADPGLLAPIGVHAPDWEQALQAASDQLLAAFIARIRGFRRASLRFARQEFLRRAGTATVDATTILVALEPNSWSPALRLAGMDENVEAGWLAPRRLEFRLEGL